MMIIFFKTLFSLYCQPFKSRINMYCTSLMSSLILLYINYEGIINCIFPIFQQFFIAQLIKYEFENQDLYSFLSLGATGKNEQEYRISFISGAYWEIKIQTKIFFHAMVLSM